MAGRWVRGFALAAAVAALAAAPAFAKIPEPFFTLYGPVTVDAVPVTGGAVTLLLQGSADPVASFRIGSIPDAEGMYVLRVPIDSLLPRTPGMARPGETVEVFVNGLWAGRAPVGERGTFAELPLEASTVHRLEFAAGPGGSPNPVASGGVSQIGVEVRDTRGHAISYAWSALCPGLSDAGIFTDASRAGTGWRAPVNLTSSLQACTLSVAVSDGSGILETRSYSQTVLVEPHAIDLLSGPSGTPNPVDSGGRVALAAGARDSHGHTLAYSWSAECPGLAGSGTFLPGPEGATSWAAPENLTGGDVACELTVVASDGIGAAQQWSFTETVRVAAHEIRVVAAATGRPNPVGPGGTVTVGVEAADTYGHAVGYAWSASCPGFRDAGTFSRPRSRTTRWEAPRRPGGGTGECVITATVRDGSGVSVASSFRQVVTDGRPVAVAGADRVSARCPDAIAFSGGGSFHPVPGRTIVSWEWDFDFDGLSFDPEASGADVTHRYGEVGSRTVALRVTGDDRFAATGIATMEVLVDGAPPVADAGGPYEIGYGAPLRLDASGSEAPGAACGNVITAYGWDLDGDGDFDDAAGSSPSVGWADVAASLCGGSCSPGASYPVAVRVSDRLGTTREASSTVGVGDLADALRVVAPNGGEMLGTGRSVPVSFVSLAPVDALEARLVAPGGGEQTLPGRGFRSDPGGAYPGGSLMARIPRGAVRTSHEHLLEVEGSSGGAAVGGDVTDAVIGVGPLDVVRPDGGETIAGGDGVRVLWRKFATVRRAERVRIRFSLDDGVTWRRGGVRAVSGGAAAWRAPRLRSTNRSCRLMVELLDGRGAVVARDTSEAPFTILGRLDVLAPEGGVPVFGGTSRTVRWRTGGLPEAVARTLIDYTLDGGATWVPSAALPANPGAYSWNLPVVAAPAPQAGVRVTLVGESGRTLARDQSEGGFTVLPLP